MKKALELWSWLKGKKTYFVAGVSVAYGLLKPDTDAFLFGLGLIGLRDGLATEVAKYFTKKK